MINAGTNKYVQHFLLLGCYIMLLFASPPPLVRKKLVYMCMVDVCKWGLSVFMYVAVCGGVLFVI